MSVPKIGPENLAFPKRSETVCQRLINRVGVEKLNTPKNSAVLIGNKVVELSSRGGALVNLEAKHAIEKGISDGKGGAFLKLSPEQYVGQGTAKGAFSTVRTGSLQL